MKGERWITLLAIKSYSVEFRPHLDTNKLSVCSPGPVLVTIFRLLSSFVGNLLCSLLVPAGVHSSSHHVRGWNGSLDHCMTHTHTHHSVIHTPRENMQPPLDLGFKLICTENLEFRHPLPPPPAWGGGEPTPQWKAQAGRYLGTLLLYQLFIHPHAHTLAHTLLRHLPWLPGESATTGARLDLTASVNSHQ